MLIYLFFWLFLNFVFRHPERFIGGTPRSRAQGLPEQQGLQQNPFVVAPGMTGRSGSGLGQGAIGRDDLVSFLESLVCENFFHFPLAHMFLLQP